MEHVTSDLHFGHENIIRFCNRPFKTAAEMDEAIRTTWNNKVAPGDTTYILGDITFDKKHRDVDELCNLFASLNGNKVVVLGNHDLPLAQQLHAVHRRSRERHGHLIGLLRVTDYLEVRHEGKKICMFHYPMYEWNGSHRGSVHFHGHCHGNRTNLPGRILDVGIDAHPSFSLWTLPEAIAAAEENYEKTKENVKPHQNGY